MNTAVEIQTESLSYLIAITELRVAKLAETVVRLEASRVNHWSRVRAARQEHAALTGALEVLRAAERAHIDRVVANLLGATQRCRRCWTRLPLVVEADYCPVCTACNEGDVNELLLIASGDHAGDSAHAKRVLYDDFEINDEDRRNAQGAR